MEEEAREKPFLLSLLSAFHSASLFDIHPALLLSEDFYLLYGDFISCGDQRKLQKQGRGKAFFEATSWFKIKAEKTDFKKACIFFLVFTPLINKKSLRFGVLKESSRPVSNSGLKGVVSLNGCY